MTEPEWNALRRLLDIEQEIDEAFGALIDEPWGRTEGSDWIPAVDIDETEDAYVVTVDLPGVTLHDVRLHVRPREIEISGKRASSRTTASAARVRSERTIGRFRRSFPLERAVDPRTAESRCADGVYQVRIMKVRTDDEHDDTREGETR
jgi:HSP20 family protein